MKDYGIYTCSDFSYFSGAVVALKALRLHGYQDDFAVIDVGLYPWMISYLVDHGAIVIPMGWTRRFRYTDVLTDVNPTDEGLAYKPFGIYHAKLFKNITYIDADYIPLCNIKEHVYDRMVDGDFLAINEVGLNRWGERQHAFCGVKPEIEYPTINAGFINFSLDHYDFVLEEWRNIMTRRGHHDQWCADQGALNAILDKYEIEKVQVGDKLQWNQTGIGTLASGDDILINGLNPPTVSFNDGRRIYGWHGSGGYRYWNCIGIDHVRPRGEAEEHYRKCQNHYHTPPNIIGLFKYLLFFDNDLQIKDMKLEPVGI